MMMLTLIVDNKRLEDYWTIQIPHVLYPVIKNALQLLNENNRKKLYLTLIVFLYKV